MKVSTNPSFFSQFTKDLKTRWGRKLGSKKKLPWMYQKEIDLLSEALLNLKPKRCLEWGSGFSTLYFPELLDKNASWLALEHNKEWYTIINKAIVDERVGVELVEADNEPYTDAHKDGSYEDFKSYIEFPTGTFDFIFIDGRARAHCVKKAFDLISSTGLVVLHDANRTHYHEHFNLFKERMLFDDFHKKYGGVWLASKETPLDSIIDLQNHQAVWKKHDRLGKILKPF